MNKIINADFQNKVYQAYYRCFGKNIQVKKFVVSAPKGNQWYFFSQYFSVENFFYRVMIKMSLYMYFYIQMLYLTFIFLQLKCIYVLNFFYCGKYETYTKLRQYYNEPTTHLMYPTPGFKNYQYYIHELLMCNKQPQTLVA